MKQFRGWCVHSRMRSRHRDCKKGPLGDLPNLPTQGKAHRKSRTSPVLWAAGLPSPPSSPWFLSPQATERWLSDWVHMGLEKSGDLTLPPAHQVMGLSEGLHCACPRSSVEPRALSAVHFNSPPPSLPPK